MPGHENADGPMSRDEQRWMSHESHDDEHSFSNVLDDDFRLLAFLYIEGPQHMK